MMHVSPRDLCHSTERAHGAADPSRAQRRVGAAARPAAAERLGAGVPGTSQGWLTCPHNPHVPGLPGREGTLTRIGRGLFCSTLQPPDRKAGGEADWCFGGKERTYRAQGFRLRCRSSVSVASQTISNPDCLFILKGC